MATPRTGRPRGRPPGAKNIQGLEAFVLSSLTDEIIAPPRKPKGKTRGIWATLKTPEERAAHSASIRAKRVAGRMGGGCPKGKPAALTISQHAALVEQQRPIIARIIKKMAEQGTLPEDPRAVEALEASLMVLRTETTTSAIKLAAARLLLDFTKAKPTSKVELSLRTAEDILDEMDDGGS